MKDQHMYGEIFSLLMEAKKKVIALQKSEDYNTPGGPYLDETYRHIEAAASASMNAGVYSLSEEDLAELPDE